MIRLFFYCSFLFATLSLPGQEMVIKNVHIIHIETGEVSQLMDIGIEAERIVFIQPSGEWNGVEVATIDGNENFVIPGLWDMHTHNSMGPRQFFPLLLANGVIGIRSMFDQLDSIQSWNRQIEYGSLIGPEIYTSGPIVDGPKPMWPGSVALTNPAQAAAHIDSLVALGIDFVKVYSFMNRETYFAIANHCKSIRFPYAGHIPDVVSIWEAADAGQKSSEHGYGLLVEANSKRDHLRSVYRKEIEDSTLRTYPQRRKFLLEHFDESTIDSIADRLSNTEMYLCPTLVVNHAIANLSDSSFRADPRCRYMNPFLVMRWQPENDFRLRNMDSSYYLVEQGLFSLLQNTMGPLERAGVKILAGTDYMNPYIFPGFSLHDELNLMVEGGMTNRGALAAATINATSFLQAEDYGEVEAGKMASFLLLEENPLDDINNTKSLSLVVQRGTIFTQEELTAELEKLARQFGK